VNFGVGPSEHWF